MLTGSLGKILVFGLALCGVFACSTYVGGWIAYGAGVVFAILVTSIVAVCYSRFEDRVGKAVAALAEGGDAESVLCEGVKGYLGKSICSIAERLSESQRLAEVYERALKGLGNPAFLCDNNGRILLVTKSFLDLLKKPATQVRGFSVSQALFNKEGPSVVDKVIKGRNAMDDFVELNLWDDRVLPVHVFASPVYGKDDNVSCVVCSFIDLTEQRVQQQEVEDQRERMGRMGEQVSGLAEHVASATELLSASADDQAQGAQKQRNQTTSVATAMEEMTATVIEVAQNATATSEAADQAYESATEGVTMVSKAVDAINQVAGSTEQLEREIQELDSQAGEIGRIINVINDIADQTNLLALNAAIEAARAGEAGRGFAVVADEVRKLAEKTMTATREVEEAIGTIQNKSRNATASMQQTAKQVGESTDLSNHAGEVLQHIMDSIKDMVSRVAQIATAAEQQSAAAEEINTSIEEIAFIAGDADEAAGQAASATRDLAGLAQELLDVFKEFKSGKGNVRLCKAEGEMMGILPKLCQDFVRKTYGADIFDTMQNEMGNPVYLPTENCSDRVLGQMAELVSLKVGVPVKEFFIGFGKFSIFQFNEMYPDQFADESLKSFYMRMNEVHSQLAKKQPEICLPSFTYEDKGDSLFMNYRSKRGLFDYFEGVLLGAADLKGEKVNINIKPFDNETARAEIAFLGKI